MVMKISKSMMNAEACSIILFNKSADNLAHKVILKKGGKTSKQSFELNEEKGIIKWAIEHKESIIIDDAYNDKRFYEKYDEIPGFTTRTMLCIPLKVKEGILGVAQVINKKKWRNIRKKRQRHIIDSLRANCISCEKPRGSLKS